MTEARKPLPADLAGDRLDSPFWEGCNRGEFLLHRCGRCGCYYWPASCCIEHGSEHMTWVPASGRGRLHTYTIVHREYHPAFADDLPYNVAVIQLAEGPFYHANVLDCPDDELFVGMELTVVFREREPGVTIPLFRRLHPGEC